MLLYSDEIDPVGHCARLALAEKDINANINFITDERPEELNDYNPYNGVLTLVDKNISLYDVQIIMEYLDERFPHPPLMPVGPMARAENRQMRYRLFRDLYQKLDDKEQNDIKTAGLKKTFRDYLSALSPAFEKTPYFMSDEYTLLDCCMAPLLWRLKIYGLQPNSISKNIKQYAERLFSRTAFDKSLSKIERGYIL